MSQVVTRAEPNMQAAALAYAERPGWPVFPCHSIRDGRCTCGDPGCANPGKHPRTAAGFKDASSDPAVIRGWWRRWPGANIGIPTGGRTFLALDVDPRNGGDETLADLLAEHGPLPDTIEAITGGGGRHVLFTSPDGLASGNLAPGLDIKAAGGYIIVSPSLHVSGNRYSWEVSSRPGEGPLAPCPAWVIERLGAKAERRQAEPLPELIPEGRRNEVLTSLAGTMRRRGASEAGIVGALRAENASRCRPPLADDELARIAASVSRYKPEEAAAPGELGTDLGITLVKDYGHTAVLARAWVDRYRWAVHRGRWMEYNGTVWRAVPEEYVAKQASDALRRHYAAHLAKTQDKKHLESLVGLIRESATYARIVGALSFLKGWDGFLTMPAEWDKDPWLFNVANGTLDLKNGKLRPHSPGDLLTRLAPVTYGPETPEAAWNAQLDLFLPNENVRRQVQRSLGVALVGACLEERLDLWWGSGANGKTTTARAVMVVCGDYALRAAPDLLVASKHDRHPTELADLAGSRLVFSVEVEDGKRLAEALVKDLTGGDRKKARHMRQDFFEFEQTFSVTLIANHRPGITGVDDAIWRRIRLIPWTVTLPENQRRPQEDILAELVADGPAVLNWLLAGLQDWQSDRTWTAPEVLAATIAYRAEQDRLAGFFADRCELGPHFTAPVKEFYEAYAGWAEGAGEEPLGKTRFGELLRQRGASQRRTGEERRWVGLRLVTNGDSFSDSSSLARARGAYMETMSPLVTCPATRTFDPETVPENDRYSHREGE